jgi:hypothetical protein
MAVAFNAGTLATISSCTSHVESVLNRGTLSSSTRPTSTQVQNWLIQAKQKLMEAHGFTWRRVFSYLDTSSGEYRYALPLDFGEGGHIIRDITQDDRLVPVDPEAFDTMFPDVAGTDNKAPSCYTIKDRELWLCNPASGTYRLELEYLRTGDDSTTTDVSYIPELRRFEMCDFAIYRAFVLLEMYESAAPYKNDWAQGISQSKTRDNIKKWSARGYSRRLWWI